MIIMDILIEALLETHSNTYCFCNSFITYSIDYLAYTF